MLYIVLLGINYPFRAMKNFFKNLGTRFIFGGDYNAKHPWWGFRLANPKGKKLYQYIKRNSYKTLATGRPIFWPADSNKIPDILDFFVYLGIADNVLVIRDSNDLNSDHTSIILSYSTNVPTITRNNKIITH